MKMMVLEFGEALLAAGDLDPVYEMLRAARLRRPLLHRWMLAYFWFYHAGVASYIAMGDDFYGRALRAFDDKFPRAQERRHFRTSSARASIEWFKKTFKEPEDAVESLAAPSFQEVRDRVLKWPLFGPWMAFKVADMLERVAGYDVSFHDCALEMYEEPTKGALIVAERTRVKGSTEQERVRVVVSFLLNHFSKFDAPPDGRRPCGIQEVETILCKYKSHLNGHYPVGKDRLEIAEGLHGWGSLAETLRRLLEAKGKAQ